MGYDKKLKVFCWVLLSLFATSVSSANDPDNVSLVPGDKVPYPGVLLPTSRAQRVEVMSLSLDSCTKISSLKDQEDSVLTQRLNNAQAENDRLAAKASPGEWEKVGAFALGVLTTIGVAFAVSHVTR